MVWAVLVAVGVAVLSMTLFGARLTRRRTPDRIVEHLEIDADPSDPWAAWKPREFEEFDRPRARIWPVLAAFTGLIMVGAGFAGARQTLWAETADAASLDPTPRPYTVEVEIPDTPSPKPTPKPTPTPAPVVATPRPTVAPAAATPAPSSAATTPAPAAGTGPTVTGSASCSGGSITVNYSATAHGADLSWIAVYVDGKAAKGGPISGQSHSSSYSQPASAGSHDVEVSVEDKAGRTSRKPFGVTCA